MMKILKKNQVIIFVIALMLITAGYLSYNPKDNENTIVVSTTLDNKTIADIGDATLVNNNNVIENAISTNTIEETSTNVIEEEKVQETTSTETTDEYFTNSRIQRDTMYSQMIESYQKILENTNISEEQKSISSNEINKINETKNAIMIAENLIKTKGFEDVVLFVNNGNVTGVVKAEKLDEQQISQIQNIITRELNVKVNKINISSKK